MGLRSMAYRADVIGGRLEIASENSAGTRVTCRLPRGNP
jgi:signal transduction histidine kinase